MLIVHIEDEAIAQKLRLRAEQEQRGVDELVSEMLSNSLVRPVESESTFYGSGAHLAQIAEKANLTLNAIFPEPEIDDMVEQSEYEGKKLSAINKVTTASEFKEFAQQSLIKSLIEIEIPNYGAAKLRPPQDTLSPKRAIPLLKVSDNPRNFVVDLLSSIIFSPSIPSEEIRQWSDMTIENVLRTWLEKANDDRWVVSNDLAFLEAFSNGYTLFVSDDVHKTGQIIRPFIKQVKDYFGYFERHFYEIIETLINTELNDVSIEHFISQRKNDLWNYLPEIKANNSFTDEDLLHILNFIEPNSAVEIQAEALPPEALEKTQTPEFAIILQHYFQKSSIITNRWRIVEQALWAHNDKRYILSIPIFLAQIEGIYSQALLVKGLIDKRNDKFYKKGSPTELSSLPRKIEATKDASVSGKISFLEERSKIAKLFFEQKRNHILHGTSTDYDEPEYSLKLVLTIYLLAEMFSEFETDNSNAT